MVKMILDGETEQPVDPQVGYVDGYVFADRILEDVLFEIKLDETGEVICTGVVPSAQDYCKQFSKKQMTEWRAEAVQAAEDSLTTLAGDRDLYIEDVPE